MPTKFKYERIKQDPKRYEHYLKSKRDWIKKKRGKRLFQHFSTYLQHRQGIFIMPFDLWKIAKRQKLICPLTGRKLTKDTASLDHIIPLCRGGSNELSNLQFIHVDANYAKRTLTEEMFIQLCRDIVMHTKSYASCFVSAR